jgi:hypothetical protein
MNAPCGWPKRWPQSLTLSSGSDHAQEYSINLVLPGAGGGDPFAAADPFAAVDGITGVLRIANSGRSTDDGVYESVKVDGELIGQGLPLELVRGYGQILSVFGRTFFGACSGRDGLATGGP